MNRGKAFAGRTGTYKGGCTPRKYLTHRTLGRAEPKVAPQQEVFGKIWTDDEDRVLLEFAAKRAQFGHFDLTNRTRYRWIQRAADTLERRTHKACTSRLKVLRNHPSYVRSLIGDRAGWVLMNACPGQLAPPSELVLAVDVIERGAPLLTDEQRARLADVLEATQ